MTRTYLVVFERVAEDNLGAWTPNIGGAVGAGDSREDARRSLLEGIDIQLEDIVARLGEAPVAVAKGVDFSEFDPDPINSHYGVEWLTVNLPAAVPQTQEHVQQAA